MSRGRVDKATAVEIRRGLKEDRDTPTGNLGISTDQALEAIRKGQTNPKQ